MKYLINSIINNLKFNTIIGNNNNKLKTIINNNRDIFNNNNIKNNKIRIHIIKIKATYNIKIIQIIHTNHFKEIIIFQSELQKGCYLMEILKEEWKKLI